MGIFNKLFSKSPTAHTVEVDEQNLYSIEKNTPVHRYPPFDKGFPVDDPKLLIQSQSQLIDKIKVAFGKSQSDFDNLVMPVINNYAEYVHLLPATSNEHHRGAGGLFRLGLEVGFYALQSSSGVIFSSKDSSENRRTLQPKWVYATFLAGLCCELYRPVTSVVVVDQSGREWQQLMMPLYKWLIENKIDRFYLRWNEPINGFDMIQRHSNAAYLLQSIIPASCLQYMNAESGQVITAMTASITGAARPNTGNMIFDLVSRAQNHCINQDLKASPEMYGKLTVGAHLEPHIIDAMRTLYNTGKWAINQKHARLWYAKDGLFCVWSLAASEITELMTSRAMLGVPNSEDTLAEILMNGSVLMPNPNGGPYWDIFLPGTGKLIKSVRIIDPSIMLLDQEIKPLDKNLCTPGAEQEPSEVVVKVEKAEQINKQPEKVTEVDKPKADDTNSVEQPIKPISTSPKQPANGQQSLLPQIAPLPVQPSAKAATLKVEPKEGDRGELFSTINEDSKRLLGCILDDYIKNESDHPVFYCEHGLAISVDEFNSKGISELLVLKEIGGRGGNGKRWLVTEAGSSKQFMTIKYQGKEINAYVLNMQVAAGLGFPMRKEKGSTNATVK